MVRGGSGAGPLTGARVVLEGAHAVPVGRERAHTLSCVRQPALDGPVRAARVYMPVHKLRRRDAGTLGPQGAAQSCLSASERKGRGRGRSQKCPYAWAPLPAQPGPQVSLLPLLHGNSRVAGKQTVRQARLHILPITLPLAKSRTLLPGSFTVNKGRAGSSSWGHRCHAYGAQPSSSKDHQSPRP